MMLQLNLAVVGKFAAGCKVSNSNVLEIEKIVNLLKENRIIWQLKVINGLEMSLKRI